MEKAWIIVALSCLALTSCQSSNNQGQSIGYKRQNCAGLSDNERRACYARNMGINQQERQRTATTQDYNPENAAYRPNSDEGGPGRNWVTRDPAFWLNAGRVINDINNQYPRVAPPAMPVQTRCIRHPGTNIVDCTSM